MGIALFSPDFPTIDAVLMTADGKTIETGTASVSAEDRFVEFCGDFVPLYKMGTCLRIVCLYGGFEVHAFTGEVYLSSPDLLRLVSVRDEVLPGACYAFQYDVSLSASVCASLTEPRRGGLFSKKVFSRRKVTFPVSLHGLSLIHAHFTAERLLEKGQQVLLSIEEPSVTQALLEVGKVLNFGQERNCYHCEMLEIDRPSRDALERFVVDLSQQNRLF